MTSYEIGIIGMGVMGANLGLNIAEHGFPVFGHDRNGDKIQKFRQQAQDQLLTDVPVDGTIDVKSFVSQLRTPRAIVLLVPAGQAVDSVIDELRPLLSPGDVLIDGGNSHFVDTDRRVRQLADSGLHFMGMGVSGGEDGARYGPSMMPGGPQAAWERVRDVLEAAAARVDGDPCVAWLGHGSAGHYVKMVHNGIEYGLIELIAESYDLMKRGLGMDHQELHDVFAKWSDHPMGGYLIEITADIMLQHDNMGDGFLLDKIRDAARQKGTGMWTSQEAMDTQIPTPIIDTAVVMRNLSDLKSERERASHVFAGPQRGDGTVQEDFVGHLEDALYGAMIMTYAQGMHLLARGNQRRNYGLHLNDVARIWRGGCIIRARLLEILREAYERDPSLENPIFDEKIADRLLDCQIGLRQVIQKSVAWGIPTPAMTAGLGYYDAYRSALLPANLIQAQRDYFGAHTYERVDREGTFHAHWTGT